MIKADQSQCSERGDEWLSNDRSELVADPENLLSRAVDVKRETGQVLRRAYQ